MLILRAYKYLFYKLYCFERLLFDPTPEFTALGLIVVVQGMNIGLLWFVAEWYFQQPLFRHLSNVQVISFMAVLAVPQYFFLMHRGRFRRIAQEFAGESERQSIAGGVVIALYIVLS